ncbi:MAG: hypothetical protein HY906_22115 [Deltaproteobacteria bacterium]|nr:hypothetical protein [Deltaproteobacteria bacterium]
MLYLESYAHRVQLAEIVSRWIVNRPRVGDVALLKGIVNFNSYAATLWLDWFTSELLTRVHGEAPRSFVCNTKGILKDYLVDHCTVHTPRVEELIARYRRFPEDYYRETPFGGRVYYLENGGRPRFIGSTRIKRFRRIAEKGARRIIDFMFTHIRDSAEAFAAERAQKLGIPLSALITPYEEQVEEFRHAERRVLKAIRRGTIQSELPIMAIPDVAGVKILASPEHYGDIVAALRATEGAKIIEEEHHTGLYNATNVRMAVPLPREGLRQKAPRGRAVETFLKRGFAADEIEPRYHDFLDYAEEHVMLEAIVSTYADAVESEIGAGMHEERVLAQRENPDYHGHFATNIRYLMDFVLGLCLAPSNEDLTDIPIKLWVRYMPDYPDVLMRRLVCEQADDSFACQLAEGEAPGPAPA